MKKIFYFAAISLLLFNACSPKDEKEKNPLADSLSKINEGLKVVITEKDSSLESFISAFNEIQDNLDEVKARQKMIKSVSEGSDVGENKKDQIIKDIQSINELLSRNNQKIQDLKNKLSNTSGRVSELEKMVAHLTSQIEEKDGEIAELRSQLERLNIEMEDLTAKYEQTTEESNQKTIALNTAYYAIGSAKELKEKGVISKEGGFIGMGKTKKLADDFNKSYFTKIDITMTRKIILASKKAKLITNHPSGSYKIEGEKSAENLIITNPSEFWSSSKYLVIITDN